MSDATDTKWPNATASWDEPDPVIEEKYITAETTNDYVNILISRDMYLLSEDEKLRTDVDGANTEIWDTITNDEATLKESLDEIRQNISDVDGTLSDSISDLRLDMESADTALQENINDVESELTELVTNLRTDMEKADTVLQDNLDVAETELTNMVTDLRDDMEKADNEIWESIDSIVAITTEEIDEAFYTYFNI